MSKLTKIGILALSMFYLFITSYGQKATDVSKEIQAVNHKFMEAIKSGDVDAIAAFYTEDGKVFPPNFETVSAEAYGNTAIEEGRYTVSAPEGQELDKGKYMVIMKKVDGTWLLHLDIFNTSMPASQ